MEDKATEYVVEVWNADREAWECFNEGYTSFEIADRHAQVLMDRGYFARVSLSH